MREKVNGRSCKRKFNLPVRLATPRKPRFYCFNSGGCLGKGQDIDRVINESLPPVPAVRRFIAPKRSRINILTARRTRPTLGTHHYNTFRYTD